MDICNVTWEHLGTASAQHKRCEAGKAPRAGAHGTLASLAGWAPGLL